MLSEKTLMENILEELNMKISKRLQKNLVPSFVLGNSQVRCGSIDIQMKDVLKDCLPQSNPKYHNVVGFDMHGITREVGEAFDEIYLNYGIYSNCEKTHNQVNQIFGPKSTMLVVDIDVMISDDGESDNPTDEETLSKIINKTFSEKLPLPSPPAYVSYYSVGPFKVKPKDEEQEDESDSAIIEESNEDENVKESEFKIMQDETMKENGPSSATVTTKNGSQVQNVKASGVKLGQEDTIAIVGNSLVRLLQERLVPNYVKSAEAIGGCHPKERGGCVVGVHLYGINDCATGGYNESGGVQISYLDLNYMISVCANDKVEDKFNAENRILGKIAHILKSSPVIPPRYMEIQMEIPLILKRNVEVEERAKVWAMFGESYKPSLFYIATQVPMITENPIQNLHERERIQQLADAAQPEYYEEYEQY